MIKIFKDISSLPEFKKDLKKLSRRFITLEGDLNLFIRNELNLYHKLRIDNRGIFQITGLKIDKPEIYKARKFACRALKGKGVKSGIRVIYAYFEEKDRVELIEIYYKGDKSSEDRGRIIRHYAGCKK